jgi:hypothetical protein
MHVDLATGTFILVGGRGHDAAYCIYSVELNDVRKFDFITSWWTWQVDSDENFEIVAQYGSINVNSSSNSMSGREILEARHVRLEECYYLVD